MTSAYTGGAPRSIGGRVRSARRSLVVVITLLLMSSDGAAAFAEGQQFVWPADAWVVATETYPWGKPHSGSADLGCPIWTPITAAREGTVTRVGTESPWSVTIDHGQGWRTLYSHLAAPASVEAGENVGTGTLLGYVGMTHNTTTPHVHFAIVKGTTRQVIPDIQIGQWVRRGQYIPGEYTGLDSINTTEFSHRVRVCVDSLSLRSKPAESAATDRVVRRGTILTVTETIRGFHHVRGDGIEGWVPWSGVVEECDDLFGIRTTREVAFRSKPGLGYVAVGTLKAGVLRQVYEMQKNSSGREWFRILAGTGPRERPLRYSWIEAAMTERTNEFNTRYAGSLLGGPDEITVRSGPGSQYPEVDSVGFPTPNRWTTIVYENHDGWYRIGENRWVSGSEALGKHE